MRLLILSDVHANQEALEACLQAAPGYDCAVNLGDIVGYGGSPNEVIERLRPDCSYHVRGNHDKACAGITTVSNFNSAAATAAFWTSRELTPENLEWLRALPAGPIASSELQQVQFVHGSPLDEDEYIVGIRDALEALFRAEASIVFFGHSHMQGGFSLYRDSGSEISTHIDPGTGAASRELNLIRKARYLINPGSVGQPRDGDWRAAFALYDSEMESVTFYRIPYDVKRAQKRILEAQLPERLAARLAIGR